MQESKEPIERPDRFSSYLRERLEDHQMAIEPEGWEGVETALNRRTARKRWLVVAGAVAAILTGLVCLLPFYKETPVIPTIAEQPAVVAPSVPQPEAIDPPEQAQPILPTTTQPARSPMLATVTLPIEEESDKEAIVSEAVVIPNETPAEEKPTAYRSQTAPKEKKQTADVPVDQNTYKPSIDTYQQPSVQRSGRSEWLVAAGFGTGSSTDLSLETYDYANDPENSPSPNYSSDYFGLDPKTGHTWHESNNSRLEHFSDVTYHLPLSFGMTVRKNISSRFALESGLIYTYLRASYSGRNQGTREAEYRYHYIGIPVNIVAYLLNQSQWNVYLSGGITAEKGIRGAWQGTYTSITNQQYEQSGTFSIPGLQWSVNTSLGISYRLQRQWSLYAEPRFSYFFDNNQPETARTDHPVSVGIGGGIRFEF